MSVIRGLIRSVVLVGLAIVAASSAPGCGNVGDSNSSTSGSGSSCTASLDSIKQIFAAKCVVCHSGSSAAAGLDLSQADLSKALVNASSGTCDGWVRVVPGNPDASLLWRKLYSDSPPCGDPMPQGTSHLPATDLACVRDWIRSLPASTPSSDGGAGDTGTGCATCGGTACVDLTTDSAHCGSCTNACPAGGACTNGNCACSGTLTSCSGSCVDLQSNTSHCGACNTACPTGALCNAGKCVCSAGLTPCGTSCVDIASDPSNCGKCGTPCPSSDVCLAGACSAGCGSLTNCSGACVDTSASTFNCGTCGTVCPSGASCVSGTCRCPSGTANCGGTCIDVTSDASNCGACGTVCSGGLVCSSGKCTCPGGGMVCGGKCVDTSSDSLNCGACNQVCGGGQTCVSGVCQCGTATPSFSADIQPIFTNNCTAAGCHGSIRPQESMTLVPGSAYSNIVNVAAKECTSRLRVKPGDPVASYLMNKLMGVNLCYGSQMPKIGTSLPRSDIDLIGAWICSGAPNN